MTPFTSATQFADMAPQLEPIWFKPNIKGGPILLSECSAVSVQTRIEPLDLFAATILAPSGILKDPAVFVRDGSQAWKFSC